MHHYPAHHIIKTSRANAGLKVPECRDLAQLREDRLDTIDFEIKVEANQFKQRWGIWPDQNLKLCRISLFNI